MSVFFNFEKLSDVGVVVGVVVGIGVGWGEISRKNKNRETPGTTVSIIYKQP